MEKKLKVSKSWKNKKNVPSLRLVGIWLKEAGFQTGDDVVLQLSEGKIIIKKI